MANEERLNIEISTSSIMKAISVILIIILLYILKDVVLIFLFALVIASAISPFANWCDQKKFPRLIGVMLLYIIVLGLVVTVFSLIIPYLSNDISQLSVSLPKVIEGISSSIEKVQNGAPKYLDFLSEIQNLLDGVSTYFQQSAQSVFGFVTSVFGGLYSFFAILVISFYLSVTRKGIDSFLGAVIPDKYEAYVIDLWKRSEAKVGRWLQGQLLLCLFVGLVVYVGLSIMGIKYALLLGLMAMILEIVPVVGPVIAAIPAVFFGFIEAPAMGFWMIVFYIVVQQIESNILVPIVLGKTIGLNPIVVLIALLVGNQLAGIPGMILSVPVSTILVEIFNDMSKQKESRRSLA